MSQDLVTVITVCYNSGDLLKTTLDSILSQTYRPIEYIIKDGDSTDNTKDIIKRYQPEFIKKGFIFKYLSEKDKGIYDAMNKATTLATGKWINFMNADDCFCSPNVIADIFSGRLINKNTKAIYGNTLRKKNFGIRRLNGYLPEMTLERMPTSHQAIFIDTKEMKSHPYNLEFRLVADYDFIYNLYKRGEQMLYVPIDVAICEAEKGFSASNKLKVRYECAKVRQIENTWSWKYDYFKIAVSIYTKIFFHTIIPLKVLNKYRRWNHKRLGK